MNPLRKVAKLPRIDASNVRVLYDEPSIPVDADEEPEPAPSAE